MIDWNDAFDNGSYTPGASELGAYWATLAEQARQHLLGETDLAYGEHPRETLDLFIPEHASGPLVVFVHGGYWHKFDKSYWSHLARGPYARRCPVAIVNYPLAPEVSIADITHSLSRAVTFAAGQVAGPIRLCGHSAGGHLVTRLASDSALLPRAVHQRLQRVVSVSGVHDLRPLVGTDMNHVLGLTDAMAEAESPVLHAAPVGVPVSVWAGACERPEFVRQTRLLSEVWGRQGGDITCEYEPGVDHFSVIDSLQLSAGTLTREVLR